MPNKKAFQYLAVPLTLVAVLMLATLGCVCHHHATDTKCSICYLNHQAMGQMVVSDRAPAALSTGIGSDTQKPFAIVIVAGLVSRLLLGFFVNPVLYEMVARDGDVLQV
jgi:AcrB/AcrD/AcrF family